MREALFSMVCARRSLDGSRVLDLFAGTGALGLEALSRGAAHVVFVENAREALSALHDNIHALGVERESTVISLRVERALRAIAGPFDVVFCDPPYSLVREPTFSESWSSVAALCDPQCTLILEHDSKDLAPEPSTLRLTATRRYGDSSLSFYEPLLAPQSIA